jgi:hypothetical protein
LISLHVQVKTRMKHGNDMFFDAENSKMFIKFCRRF